MSKTWVEMLKEFEGMKLKEVRDFGPTYALVFDDGTGYHPSINYLKSNGYVVSQDPKPPDVPSVQMAPGGGWTMYSKTRT